MSAVTFTRMLLALEAKTSFFFESPMSQNWSAALIRTFMVCTLFHSPALFIQTTDREKCLYNYTAIEHAVGMASSIAKAVVGSKINDMTHGLESAVGLDKGQQEADAKLSAAEQERRFDAQQQRKKEKWTRDKADRHADKEGERKDIRDKYQLPAARDKQASPPAKPQPQEEEKKCCIS